MKVGDTVLAKNVLSGKLETKRVTEVHVNNDPVTGTVTISGEIIHTTPEHPFYTSEGGWVDAKDLVSGAHVLAAEGGLGTVEDVRFRTDYMVMYNLTVADDHTFFVGAGKWLVHNAGCGSLNPRTSKAAEIGREAHRQIQAEEVAFRGARAERPLDLPSRRLRKDLEYPDGSYGIIKPYTSSGIASAARRQALLAQHGIRSRVIHYAPDLPRWRPSSASYIGPRGY